MKTLLRVNSTARSERPSMRLRAVLHPANWTDQAAITPMKSLPQVRPQAAV